MAWMAGPRASTPPSGSPIFVEIPVNNGPISGIATSPDGSRLMVTNYGHNSVSIIDTDSCRVVETVAGVDEPFAIAVGGPEGIAADRAYVSSVSTAYDSIEVIDVFTNTVVASHRLALSVSDLAVSADGKYVYASRNGAGSADVVVMDTATGPGRGRSTSPGHLQRRTPSPHACATALTGVACTSAPTGRPAGGLS